MNVCNVLIFSIMLMWNDLCLICCVMKCLHYVLSFLIRARSNIFVKIPTLAAGMLICFVLFGKIAFDLSYERFLPGYGNIYQIQMVYTTGIGTEQKSETDYAHTFRPVAPSMALEIPGVAAGTSILDPWPRVLYDGENRYEAESINADTAFFRTFPFKVLYGNPSDLALKGNVFISESLSRVIFKGENPVGKTVFSDAARREPLTVAGVFEDVRDNTHLRFNMVSSLEGYGFNWDYGDGFTGYVRLHPEADVDYINNVALPQLMERHMDVRAMREGGYSFRCYLKPIADIHITNGETMESVIIISILAVLVLVTVSFNYILISVSSLAVRARSMAIHKCCGAVSRNIFSMQFAEVLLTVAVSVALAVLFLLSGKDVVQSLTGVTLESMFYGTRILIPVAVVVSVVLVTGLVSAWIYACVPAAHVFNHRNYERKGWKKFLLGVQMAVSAFISVFMAVAVLQYERVSNRPMGYEPDNMVLCNLSSAGVQQRQLARYALAALPDVECCTFVAFRGICEGLNGMPLVDYSTGTTLGTVRYTWADSSFLETMRIPLHTGRNIPNEILYGQYAGAPLPSLISESLADMMMWDDGSPVGRLIENLGVSVAGVIGDIVVDSDVGNLQGNTEPAVLVMPLPQNFTEVSLTIRLREMSPEALSETDRLLKELFPKEDIVLRTYNGILHESYRDTMRFRNSVMAASAFMVLITILGLTGYVLDEINRRSKEISLRKVNGAVVSDIEALMLRSTLAIAVPAIAAGAICAYPAARVWLTGFADRISLAPSIFVAVICILAVLVALCVFLLSWAIANENPVRNLKSE